MAQILSAHPIHATFGIFLKYDESNVPQYYNPMRRLAGYVGKFGAIDFLQNPAEITRADWDWSITFLYHTIALIRRGA